MNNILNTDSLHIIVSEYKKDGLTVGLCHGCFDIVHLGHIYHFKQARKMVDHLIISITADEFVNKGIGRPVFSSENRAAFMSAIRYCDYVTISNYPTAKEIISKLKPDIFFKGPDYLNSRDGRFRSERELMESIGGKLYITDNKIVDSSTRIASTLISTRKS
jgi:rfaE bifunctional protein nucleotidyltransferase chain/domain